MLADLAPHNLTHNAPPEWRRDNFAALIGHLGYCLQHEDLDAPPEALRMGDELDDAIRTRGDQLRLRLNRAQGWLGDVESYLSETVADRLN